MSELAPTPDRLEPEDREIEDREPESQEPELVEEPHRRLQVLKDNIEAFTIALILALVIKHFCVEAFKIPTGSMMPTLYGATNTQDGVGDRILVDKWAYLGRDPERWDVVVFRYPLNQSKHFIKRVVGVGGEWIKIVRGDVWTRKSEDEEWRIAPKRRRVRDELYLPVYPPGGDSPWRKPASEYWEGDAAWRVPDPEDYGRLVYAGGEPATIAFQKRIGDTTTETSTRLMADGDLVRDARFQLAVTAESPAVVSLGWVTDEEHDVVLRLAFGDAHGPSSVRARSPRGEEVRELADLRLAPGTRVDVELEVVDGHVYAHVDGTEVASIDRGLTLDDGRGLEDFDQRFEIEAAGGALAIEGLRVQRDVEYTRRGMTELAADGPGFRVKEGHFFMLGDNTRHSSDSRAWELEVVVLQDGTEIRYESGDSENRPRYDAEGWLTVVDREGIERRWRDEDEVNDPQADEPAPLVPRELVVGRAFFVFWPIHLPHRAGFIH